MVKCDNAAALGAQVIVAGELANNVRALNSGWTAKDPVDIGGTSILKAFQNRLGEENVTYYPTAAEVPADLAGQTVILVIGEKSGTHEPSWGTANLEFPEDQAALMKALDDAGANVVAVVLMNRAYVMTNVADMCDSVLLAYRPGVTCGAEAVVGALYGETPITGRLPFQIPRNMEQVLAQREDLPKDIVDPLYEYGFGIDVAAFGQ
jgi:beta-glucosidase